MGNMRDMMRAQLIVRTKHGNIVQLIEVTNLGEQAVAEMIVRVKEKYGEGFTIDDSQVQYARAASAVAA